MRRGATPAVWKTTGGSSISWLQFVRSGAIGVTCSAACAIPPFCPRQRAIPAALLHLLISIAPLDSSLRSVVAPLDRPLQRVPLLACPAVPCPDGCSSPVAAVVELASASPRAARCRDRR